MVGDGKVAANCIGFHCGGVLMTLRCFFDGTSKVIFVFKGHLYASLFKRTA